MRGDKKKKFSKRICRINTHNSILDTLLNNPIVYTLTLFIIFNCLFANDIFTNAESVAVGGSDDHASTSSSATTYSSSSSAMTGGSSGGIGLNSKQQEQSPSSLNGSSDGVNININNNNNTSTSETNSDAIPTESYPRNITFVYQADWKTKNNTTVAHLEFESNSGVTLFSIINYPIEGHNFDTVEGEMVIRDGNYTTDSTKKYTLNGIYEYTNGLLSLVALPRSWDTTIPLNITNTTTAQIIKEEMNIALKNYTSETDCVFKINFQYGSGDFQSSDDDNEKQLHAIGEYISAPCRVDLKVYAKSLLAGEFHSKLLNYVIMVSLCSFLQIFLLTKQMDFTGTQSGAAKISLYAVGMQTIIDAYLCLLHLTAGVVIETMFNAFATASFFQFVTFSLFEMRYLLIILKARRPQAFADGWNSLRREFSMFYLRFYSFLISGFIIMYYFGGLFPIFLFIMFSYWVPQIINNAMYSTRRPFQWQYVIGMSYTRLAVPLYFYGCPNNFMAFEPDSSYSILLVLWMSFQILILYSQEKLGPQFFIPTRFLPPKYHYYRAISQSIKNRDEGMGCVICMNDVEANDSDYMITPCDHIFHSQCLQQWMDYKMECPSCRSTLPPQ